MGEVKPLGQDPATQKQHELVSAIAQTGKFGIPLQQEGSNGQEFIFHCPVCVEDDGKGEGHRPHLRVSRSTTSGRETPFVGCRHHDSPEDWKRIRNTLVSEGVPAGLLGVKNGRSAPSAKSGIREGGLHNKGVDKTAYAEYKSRPEGLGETHPIPEGRIQRWVAALWSGTDGANKALKYLRHTRGLTDSTIEAAQIGLSGNKIVLPIRGVDGTVVAARYRKLLPGGKVGPWKPYPHPKLKKEDGRTPVTYGAPTRFYGVRELALDTTPADDGLSRPVWICAGEWDRLTLLQCGALSVSPTNGEGSLARLEDAEYLKDRDVYIVFDCDAAGRKGALKNAAAASKVGARSVYVLDLDPERDDGYDVSDFFLDKDSPDFDAFAELSDRISALSPYELPAEGEEVSLDELSDRRMAEIVARRYSEQLKFVVPSQTWIHWSGKRWENFTYRDNSPATNAIVDTARDIKDIAKSFDDPEWAEKVKGWTYQYVNRTHASAREHLTSIDDMRVALDSLDRLPVLNTPEGILDLSTGEVTAHDPAKLLRWMTNGSYVADKTALSADERKRFANWNSFLKRVLPSPEMRRYVQRLLGYSLLDGNPRRLLIFVKGGTSTGKSVFAETVMAALGSYAGPFNMSLLRDNQDEKPRADIVESLTQRIIFASETSSEWHLHADAIKRMTGGDTIKARLPHRGEYFERIPAFTPWVRTNEVPQVRAADMALERRLIVVPFNETIAPEEEDPEAMDALRRESGDAVITWAVGGLRAYLKHGLGDMPMDSVEAKFEFSSQLSPLHAFLEEMCDRGEPDDERYQTPIADLYGAYENWCFVNGLRDVISKIDFGRKLSGIGIGAKMSNGVRWRLGVRLNESAAKMG